MGDTAYELDYGLKWVCTDAARVLHYSCGDGEILRRCAGMGTQIHIGIDASPRHIAKARQFKAYNSNTKYYFRCGGVSALWVLLQNSFDAAIIWGGIDDLSPEDGQAVLSCVFRLLAVKGRAILKLGAHDRQGEGICLNDMPLLWGMSVSKWVGHLEERFIVKPYRDIYNKERRQHEGFFLLQKPEF